jgi:glutathione synthase/RimK-type ligase-like ATP-grasp enzyme
MSTTTADSTAAPIVLVGSPLDEHIAAINGWLLEHDATPYVLDASKFPGELTVTLGAEPEAITVGGEPLGRPAAVYLRSIYQDPVGYGVDADADMSHDWRRTMMAYRERGALLSAILQRWEAAGVPMYNTPTSLSAVNKPYQLSLLQRAGLPVPATLWTNDPEQVRAFCRDRAAIYKPVSGGAMTRELEDKDLTDERLAMLVGAPVCFQELLPGKDIRVFVIDGEIAVALRIDSDAIDFRANEQKIEAIELAPEDAAVCVAATRALGLRWTGMDLKGDRHGRLRILELNSSAMFLGFDAMAGCDVRGAISRALLGHLGGDR